MGSMRKLTKKQEAALMRLCSAVDEAREKVSEAVAAANEKIGSLNTAIEELNNFASEISAETQNYFDDKSERWQESDAGAAYQGFVTSWEEECSPIDEIDDPSDQVEIPDWPMEVEG